MNNDGMREIKYTNKPKQTLVFDSEITRYVLTLNNSRWVVQENKYIYCTMDEDPIT